MIALIDYDAGNTCSVMNALDRIGADYQLSDDHHVIQTADKVIFPGVGHAGAAMDALRRKGLTDVIKKLTQPVLGICVGMQLLSERSAEGDTTCLGIISGEVIKFESQEGYKVPHMGWNKLKLKNIKDSLFFKIGDDQYFYFVHSYYLPLGDHTIASCTYDQAFSAAVRKDNFVGIQFHAEKSGDNGALLIANFLNNDL